MQAEVSLRSDDGLFVVAERWFVGGRVVAAAATGSAGVVAAIGGIEVPAAPLLLLALVLAANTLVGSLAARRVPIAPRLRLLIHIAIDLTALLLAAPHADGLMNTLRIAAAVLAGAAFAWLVGEVSAAAREDLVVGESACPAASMEPWLVAFAETLADGVREPLGIVRARAEILRLALAEEPALAELSHDADVLLARVAEAQRSLLSIFALSPVPAARGRIDLVPLAEEVVREHALAERVALVRSRAPAAIAASHDEVAVVLRGTLDVVASLASAQGRVRMRLRANSSGAFATLRFPLASPSKLRELEQGRIDPKTGDLGAALALLLARRVARRMDGALEVFQRGRQGEIALALPGAPVLESAPPEGGDRLARLAETP